MKRNPLQVNLSLVLLLLSTVTASSSCSPGQIDIVEGNPQLEAVIGTVEALGGLRVPNSDEEVGDSLLLGRIGTAKRVGNRILVLDLLTPHVKVCDDTGMPIRSFVSDGEGPGEMSMPVALAAINDSTFAVGDIGGRISIWRLNGALLKEFSFPGLLGMEMIACADDLVLYGPVTNGAVDTFAVKGRQSLVQNDGTLMSCFPVAFRSDISLRQ